MASSPYIVTKGVVLRETETRDADKILTLLTAERGKLSVIARGVCRKGCKFAACAQPLAYSEWTLYKKGDWYYANEGATLELFNGLRANLDAMALGSLWRTPAPTAVAPIPNSRISTFCRAFSAAGPAERGAGVFHCVGIH